MIIPPHPSTFDRFGNKIQTNDMQDLEREIRSLPRRDGYIEAYIERSLKVLEDRYIRYNKPGSELENERKTLFSTIRGITSLGKPEDVIRFINGYDNLKEIGGNLLCIGNPNIQRGFLFSGWTDIEYREQSFQKRLETLLLIIEIDKWRRGKQRYRDFTGEYWLSHSSDKIKKVTSFASKLRSKSDVFLPDDVRDRCRELLDLGIGIEKEGRTVVEDVVKYLHSRVTDKVSGSFVEKLWDFVYRSLSKEDKTAKPGPSIIHDLLLIEFLRSTYRERIESVIVGDTISHFLSLDPELKSGRCTGGMGEFREASLQYPFHRGIKIVDLSFNHPENKVAEVVLVEANGERGNYLVVETAEAGMEAYMLPEYRPSIRETKLRDYFSHPAWAYLLLEEVVEKAYRTGATIVFNTNIDSKPAPNDFLSAAADLLDFTRDKLVAKIPVRKRYDPDRRFRGHLVWDEFLTATRWEGCKDSGEIYLQKETVNVAFTRLGIPQETYLGAWAARDEKRNPINDEVDGFGFAERNPNINNGRGYVRGIFYEVIEDRYISFKAKMKSFREAIGLMPTNT